MQVTLHLISMQLELQSGEGLRARGKIWKVMLS